MRSLMRNCFVYLVVMLAWLTGTSLASAQSVPTDTPGAFDPPDTEYTTGDAKEIGLINNDIEQQVSINGHVTNGPEKELLIDSNKISQKINTITSSHICAYMFVGCMR